MKLRKRDLFLLVAAPALVLGTIGTVGGIEAIKVDAAAPTSYPLSNYKYELVTSSTTLADGDLVTIAGVASDTDYAIAESRGNNFGVATFSKSTTDGVTTIDSFDTTGGAVSVFRLVADGETGRFAFKSTSANQYLAATGGTSSNYLAYVNAGSSIENKSSFTITIGNSNAASIVANFTGNKARNTVRFNSGNDPKIISCYNGTSQQDVYLYKVEAKTSSYTVDFVTNCGQTVASQQVAVGGKVTEPTGLTKEGYSIHQWTTDKEWRTGWNFDTVVTGDMTLYADWVKDNSKVCTLTFNLNGKTGDAPATQEIPEEHYFSTVTDPTYYQDDLAKYTFVGWYEKDNQGNFLENAFNFNVKYSESKTVYAKWSEGDYLFKTSFGDNQTVANLSFTYDSEVIPGTPGNAVWASNEDKKHPWSATNDGVTISYSGPTNGGGSLSDPGCRIYGGSTFTISCPYGITSITLTSAANNGASNGLGSLSLADGQPGTYVLGDKTATWTGESITSVTFTASAQVRLNGLTVTHGAGDVTNYSNFRDVKMQFRYDLSGLGPNQKKWYKAAKDIATETGLFVTDDTSFTFETKDNLNVAAGKIGKKYANEEANQESPNYTVGIMIPDNHYNTVLRAASYVLMPDGNYYWNTKKEYSVLTMLQAYSTNQNVSGEAKAACSAFVAYINTQNA